MVTRKIYVDKLSPVVTINKQELTWKYDDAKKSRRKITQLAEVVRKTVLALMSRSQKKRISVNTEEMVITNSTPYLQIAVVMQSDEIQYPDIMFEMDKLIADYEPAVTEAIHAMTTALELSGGNLDQILFTTEGGDTTQVDDNHYTVPVPNENTRKIIDHFVLEFRVSEV